MTSQEIFKRINTQQMIQQEQQAKLQEAMTALSKQSIVSQAITQQGMPLQGQMPSQTNPQGWGRTS